MSNWSTRAVRVSSKRSGLWALICVLAGLVLAPSASASITITKDKESPVIGEVITFTASVSSDCGYDELRFEVDGVVQPMPADHAARAVLQKSFADTAVHTIKATYKSPPGTCSDATENTTFPVQVRAGLAGSISVTPESPAPGQTVALAASQTGGYAGEGFTYAWDSDNDGSFDDQTTRTFTTVYPTAGTRTVRVRVRDGVPAPNTHESIVTKAIVVAVPTTPPTTPATTPPATTPAGTELPPSAEPPATQPACTRLLAFALSEFTTTGCFTQVRTTPSAQWTTTDAIKLNGVPFADFGQTFTITFPTTAEPGGHFTAPDSSIKLKDGFAAFSGDVDWTLPAGKKGDEKVLRTFSVFAGAKMFGLNVKGSIALRLGWDAAGVHYASFPLNIELPVGFRAGPDPSTGRVTGTAALRADLGGIRFDGLKLEAKDVWIGKLKVPEACFSYVPAGGQSVSPCKTPTLDKQEFITCKSDVTTDRWDGNATIELPTANHTRLAAFGGLAGGQVSKLGGFVDNLGTTLPLAPNVYLNRVGVGLCLSPALKLKGVIGVAIVPTAKTSLIGINGTVEYTEGEPYGGWTLAVGGSVTVLDRLLGEGAVSFDSYGRVDFRVNASFDLYGVASLAGGINGWVDTNRKTFNISGFIKGCLAGELCADASAVISSTGVAGCIKAGTTYDDYIVILDHSPYLRWEHRPTTFSLGFGYRWGASSVDLLGRSCNFSPYEAVYVRPVAARAGRQTAPISEKIEAGTKAVALSIHGSGGPPKLILRGPDGTTITSPTDARTAQVAGKYTLVENTSMGTTEVALLSPAAGMWTIEGVPGMASTPTKVERSELEAAPTLVGKVSGKGTARTLDLTYALPKGAMVQLVERGDGVTRTIATSVKGRRCSFGAKLRPGTDQPLQCAQVRFSPAPGPGGRRTIQAIVSRDSIPLADQQVASFRAPKQTLPRIAALRARRAKGALVVTFPRSSGASRYTVSAVLSDGRALAFDLESKCGGVRIPAVPIGISAKVEVSGVRYDLATGKKRSLSIAKKQKSAGPKGRVAKQQAGKICS